MVVRDDVIKWKHFPRYWPYARGIHRWPVDSPHKGQWRGALMFSLICAWTNGRASNRVASDLTRHRSDYDVTVMVSFRWSYDATMVNAAHVTFKNSVGKWCRHRPRYWPFVRGIHRWPMDSPHKGPITKSLLSHVSKKYISGNTTWKKCEDWHIDEENPDLVSL